MRWRWRSTTELIPNDVDDWNYSLFLRVVTYEYLSNVVNWSYQILSDIHTCIHTCIHTYIHTYIHTHIHTYIHTCMHVKNIEGIKLGERLFLTLYISIAYFWRFLSCMEKELSLSSYCTKEDEWSLYTSRNACSCKLFIWLLRDRLCNLHIKGQWFYRRF